VFEATKERSEMVSALCEHVILNQQSSRVEIYIDGGKDPLLLNHKTVKDIVEGERRPSDLTFGPSLFTPFHRMWESISRWFVLRAMPGQENTYECPACGRGAVLEALHLHCAKCGHSFVCTVQFAGVSADLMESLETNKDLERYYVDRPWNKNPPWMSQEELTEALGLYLSAVRAFNGGSDGTDH
jgi:hypothetical protein